MAKFDAFAKQELVVEGRRQIVALRFAGEDILPCNGSVAYGVQAIVRTRIAIMPRVDFETLLKSSSDLRDYYTRPNGPSHRNRL